MSDRYGLSRVSLLNHSGLTPDARMTAAEMVQLLDIAAQEMAVRSILKGYPLAAARGRKDRMPGVEVRAKTGTLNFTRGLAGYLDGQGGKRLAFAYFASNLKARAAAKSGDAPRGASGWRRRAINLEADLLRHWSRVHLS